MFSSDGKDKELDFYIGALQCFSGTFQVVRREFKVFSSSNPTTHYDIWVLPQRPCSSHQEKQSGVRQSNVVRGAQTNTSVKPNSHSTNPWLTGGPSHQDKTL